MAAPELTMGATSPGFGKQVKALQAEADYIEKPTGQ